MKFFDTHAHLDLLIKKTDDTLQAVISNAKNANIEKIFIPAISAKNFQDLTAYAQQFPANLVYGLGLHPYFIAQHSKSDLDLLKTALQNRDKQCVAVAEIGLDKRLDKSLWEKQCDYFSAQLELAKQFDLPVSIHSVKTHAEILHFLKQISPLKTGVIHGFTGSYEQAKQFVDLGYKIGVGGSITYPRANKTRQAIAKLPLDSLVLETDSPDMPVNGFQGESNRPEQILIIFESLCELRKESKKELNQAIWQSSLSVFD